MELLVNSVERATPPEVTLDNEGADVDATLSEGCRVIMEASK